MQGEVVSHRRRLRTRAGEAGRKKMEMERDYSHNEYFSYIKLVSFSSLQEIKPSTLCKPHKCCVTELHHQERVGPLLSSFTGIALNSRQVQSQVVSKGLPFSMMEDYR